MRLTRRVLGSRPRCSQVSELPRYIKQAPTCCGTDQSDQAWNGEWGLERGRTEMQIGCYCLIGVVVVIILIVIDELAKIID